MTQAREPNVAGQFYPGRADTLKSDVDALLAAAATNAPCPKAVIAPHAGYVFSGPIAASAYARVKNGADKIRRVVLLGPAHRVGFEGIAAPGAEVYVTPLGAIPVDTPAVNRICQLPFAGVLDRAHNSGEHSLEVHLPFLQRCLGEFTLLPLVVGQASPDQVAQVIDSEWGGDETLVVISSDLSHYLPYDQARATDADTALKIQSLHSDLVGEQACGCRPINGLNQVLRRKGMHMEALDVRNSGDTAGDKNRVVGYGAFMVSGDTTIPLALRQQLLQLARNSIYHRLSSKEDFSYPRAAYAPVLREIRGSFVTLNLNGRLRGCIGSLQAHRPLSIDVAHNAQAAAFNDPRFKPVSMTEYPLLDIHISVLSTPETFSVESRQELLDTLRPGVDGLILEENGKRATYLPSVWSSFPDPERFVSELRAKAGLPRDGWSDQVTLQRYTTEEFA